MASKEVKALLKEAREAIKNKEFQLSLKLSKTILKDDPENYMALIFLGLSLQELGPKEQIPITFWKAIDANSNNALAWNGLANYYEKLGDATLHKELISIYVTLLQIESNDKKISEICDKILMLNIVEENIIELISALEKIVNRTDLQGETITSTWTALAYILSNHTEVPSSLLDIYEKSLSHVLNTPKQVTKKYYNDYFKLLYKRNKYTELLEEANKMHEIYNTDSAPLEWICKVYNESIVEGTNNGAYKKDNIKKICDILLNLQSNSSIGLFTKSVFLYEDNNFSDSLELLNQVTDARPGLLHAWVLMANCCMKLHLYSDASQAALKADKLLLSIKNTNTILRKEIDLLLLQSLSHHGDDESLHMCVEVGRKLDYEDVRILKYLVRCYIKLENYIEAKVLLSKLKKYTEDNFAAILLNAQLLHKQGKLTDGLELLLKNEPDALPEWWFEIGLLYWELNNFDKCLVPFLKAAKLDPNCYIYFLYLGHYYKNHKNPDKARRCYEKAFRMNQKCIEAAIELTKLFRANRNWDANVELLQSVTGDVPDVETEWAWLQLGLNYLVQEDYSRAIDALHYALRVDPNNSHYWESLGDAYMGRGAYTSALKSYQRALEITPNLLYPLLQIANIKRSLGDYMDAKKIFEQILTSNKSYVPALKGLAETCVLQARHFRRNTLFGSARDYAQTALDAVIVGIKQCNNLSCLWKLAGDSCSIVASLPERYCCMLVLAALAEGASIEGNKILEKDELFTLAERFYYKAATLIQDSETIWHDLGACFLSHAMSLPYNTRSEELYNKAATVADHCINLHPGNWKYWNLKGLIAVSSGKSNYALAQHSFIKAVLADDHSATAWCNLGTLYLILEDFKLANEAFAQAQRADPKFVNCWIGQALIAENLDYSEDAMDLFRHSTQLGVHPESCIGYGHWVCKTLLDAAPHAVIYSIHKMHAVPIACDALTWYTDNNPDDSCAWNMLGILRERMGLKDSAAQAFRSALLLCSKEFRDKCRINYARLLFKQQKYKQAVDVYNNVQEATFNSGSGLALALFKDHRYEESYEVYEQALHWLTEEQALQSDLLVALASMAYTFQGPDAAKTLLFQSTELKSPSPYGLYATLSLGLLHKDMVLSKLVLKEISNLKDDVQCLPHYVALYCYTCLSENNHMPAIREISKLVHSNPNSAFLWLSLSSLLLRLYKQDPSLVPVASKTAILAAKLGLEQHDAAMVWCIVSLALLLIRNYKEASKMAQRAIYCYPQASEGWAALISTLLCFGSKTSELYLRIPKLVKHVKDHLKPSEPLLEWLNKI